MAEQETCLLSSPYQPDLVDAVPGLIFDGWIKATELSQENLGKIIDGLLERKKHGDEKAAKTAHKGGKPTP